jgi:glycosyltransferase involved in cell wall biosynthesis
MHYTMRGRVAIAMSTATIRPAVTVVLPTYNRAGFLRGAFESLAAQTFTDWELVIVDDGSTDGTREGIDDYLRSHDRVRYVYQANRGAYAARNRGVDEATGTYLAFFDSDDLWLPHHLERCVGALAGHPEIDWVFGACRQVDRATGVVLDPNTSYINGQPRPFLSLKADVSDGLHIITDRAVLECQISHGLYCGLQNSVMKRRLFEGRRFNDRFRVVEDELFVIRVLAAGARFAYFIDPHVIYQVHSENSSASATSSSLAKHVEIYSELTVGIEQLLSELTLSPRERRGLLKRLGREYFWHLGYVGFWQAGRRLEALDMYRRGLAVWPWHPGAWKTYLLARLRVALQSEGHSG